jgi:hypothetical protein
VAFWFLGVPHVGLLFGFYFGFGLYCIACWDVAAAFFSTWCKGWADFSCGGMQKPLINPQAAKSIKPFLIYGYRGMGVSAKQQPFRQELYNCPKTPSFGESYADKRVSRYDEATVFQA